MSGTRALLAGLRRAVASPHLVLLVLLTTALAAAPAAWLVRDELHDSIGKRVASERMLESFDAQWFDEWRADADWVDETFGPWLAGPGAAWANLEAWLDGGLVSTPPALLLLGAVHALVWLFLLGGILDGWARPGPRGPVGFVRACSAFWPRLIRLGLCSIPLYATVYLAHGRLVERLEEATRDLASELPAIVQMLALYALTAALLLAVNLWVTAAKAVVVVDDRRSVLAALGRAALFVIRRAPSALGLQAGVVALGAGRFVVWSLVAPDASQSTPTAIALAFAVGQLHLVARIGLRLAHHAGFVALYRSHVEAAGPRHGSGAPAGVTEKRNPPAPAGGPAVPEGE